MVCQAAGEHRSHDLLSPSASKNCMDEPCLASQTTVLSDAGGDVDAPRSCARAIPLGVVGGANSRMRLSSPVTPPLVWDRKAGTLGKGRCLGGLQIDVTEKFQIAAALHPCRRSPKRAARHPRMSPRRWSL